MCSSDLISATTTPIAGPQLATGVAVAVLSSVVPYSLELLALRRIDTRVFGILLSLDPAVAAVAGLLILGEALGAMELLGMALVVAASVLVVVSAPSAAGPAATSDREALTDIAEIG